MSTQQRRRFWAQETTSQRSYGWAAASDPAETPRFHDAGDLPGASGLLRALTAIRRVLEHCNTTGITNPVIICANREAVRLTGRRGPELGDVPRDCRDVVTAIRFLKTTVAAKVTRHVADEEREDKPQQSTGHWMRAMERKLADHMPRKGTPSVLLTYRTSFWRREAERAVAKARGLQERGCHPKQVTEWLERATAAATQTGLVNGSKHPLIALGLIANTTDAN